MFYTLVDSLVTSKPIILLCFHTHPQPSRLRRARRPHSDTRILRPRRILRRRTRTEEEMHPFPSATEEYKQQVDIAKSDRWLWPSERTIDNHSTALLNPDACMRICQYHSPLHTYTSICITSKVLGARVFNMRCKRIITAYRAVCKMCSFQNVHFKLMIEQKV